MPSDGYLSADETALRFDAPDATVLDLLIDDRRIWSFSTDSCTRDKSGRWVKPWPEPIAKRLDGVATLTLRNTATNDVLAQRELRFGSGEGRVSMVDDLGRPLAMHKWGKLQQPFDAMGGDVLANYLDFVDDLMRILREECGVESFMSFGALLGARRSGKLIGHDVDIDIGYFSEHTYPVDVMRESFAIERVLRRHNVRTVRDNGGFLQVFAKGIAGRERNVDIFSCWVDGEGGLFQINDIATTGTRETVLPVRQIELEGRTVPAPRDIETFLVAAYGEGWRVPDPTFSYGFTPGRRRMRGWTGGLREEWARWRDHYRDPATREVGEPSDFARAVLPDMRAHGVAEVVDIGCGPGADTLFFARNGLSAVGLDLISSVVKPAAGQAKEEGLPAVLQVLNLGSVRDTLHTGAMLARRPGPRAVFARHIADELSRSSQPQLWLLCSMLLRGGGRSYLEFTIGAGKGRARPFSDRDAMPINPRAVLDATARYGAVEVDRTVTETPGGKRRASRVCRMTLEWR